MCNMLKIIIYHFITVDRKHSSLPIIDIHSSLPIIDIQQILL
jgi:hypothetical protein